MKKIFLFLFVCSFITGLHAATYVSSFYPDVPTDANGAVRISATAPTTIPVKFSCSRGWTGTAWEDVNLKIRLTYIKDSYSEVIATTNVTTADFNNTYYCDKVINISIPAGYVNGSITMTSSYFNPATGQWVDILDPGGFWYFLTTYAYPLPDGDFREYGGNVYWCFAGQWRHIESSITFLGLFSDQHYTSVTVLPTPVGVPLGVDNGLIHDVTTGKVYFREGNLLRHINNMTVKERYKFNWNSLTNVTSINSYIVGEPIY